MKLRVVWALVSAVWREKLAQPGFLLLYLVVAASQAAAGIAMRDLRDPTPVLALFVAAGSVGRDVSSGVLPLLFTRPLVRTTYVLSKWLAVSIAAAGLGAFAIGTQAVLLARQGHGVPGGELGAALFSCVTMAFGTCAVMVLLSVMTKGLGDLGLYMILTLLAYIPRLPQRLTEEWQGLMRPSLAWDAAFSGPVSWFAIFSYLSTVTLALSLAALAVNRKELSYATSG